jgi:glucose dehydrogenase
MNKSGLTFVLDRATGQVLSAFDVAEVRNWITGITEEGKLIGRKEPVPGKPEPFCPSAAGAKNWNSMAFSPRTGFIYVPANEICNDITAEVSTPSEGKTFMAGTFKFQQSTESRDHGPCGCMGSSHGPACLERSARICFIGFDARHSR